jgi:hypothetical protein
VKAAFQESSRIQYGENSIRGSVSSLEKGFAENLDSSEKCAIQWLILPLHHFSNSFDLGSQNEYYDCMLLLLPTFSGVWVYLLFIID